MVIRKKYARHTVDNANAPPSACIISAEENRCHAECINFGVGSLGNCCCQLFLWLVGGSAWPFTFLLTIPLYPSSFRSSYLREKKFLNGVQESLTRSHGMENLTEVQNVKTTMKYNEGATKPTKLGAFGDVSVLSCYLSFGVLPA